MPFVMASAASIDTGLVSELIAVVKSCMGLFSEFPMNVFIIGSIVGLGFGIFRRAKSASGGAK